MNAMKCRFVVLFSIVGLLLGGFVALAAPARAASIYDSVYQTTDSLIISNNPDSQSQYSCPELDIATEYMSLMQDPNNWVSEDSYNWFMPGFMQAVSSGGAWAVTQQEVYYGNSKIVNVGYSLQSGKGLEWHADRVEVSDMMTVSIEHIKYDWITCQPIVGGVSGEGGAMELSGALSGSGIRNFLAYGFDPNYPSEYEGEEIRETWSPPPARYVAMGDSFSSGEGNSPFEAGTDIDSVNECRRSDQAYPRLLENDPGLDLWPAAFVACSGATTNSVLNGHVGSGNWSEGSQIGTLSEDTQVVTVTIGGNDVGFKEYVTSCMIGLACGVGTEPFNTILGNIDSQEFSDSLEETYEAILNEAPNAKVYVIGYPYMTAEGAAMCGPLLDATGGRLVQEALNFRIWGAVFDLTNTTSSARLYYVDPNQENSPFEGRHLCNGSYEFFNGFKPNDWNSSFHPNSDGHLAYYEVVKEAVAD